MIEVRRVSTPRERRESIDFPNKLYKGCPYYVPPLYLDEKKIFRKDYTYYDTCEAVFFNAYIGRKMVGRISGILQRSANEKWGQKRVRFTRFDVIDDFEVAAALFEAVEGWAASKGMEEVVGPLGYSDLEREGLLVEGFDQMSTFEEAYNYDYYARFIEKLGYKCEVEWVESQIRYPSDASSVWEMEKMSNFVMKRYNLHINRSKNTKDFLARYSNHFFKVLDDSYAGVYGTVPFTPAMKKMMIENFNLIIDMRFVIVILDEHENPVAFGICFPSIAKAMQMDGGHLTPRSIIRLLRDVKKPEVLDLGLIGVEPEYFNRGVSVVIASALARMLSTSGIKYADTNLNLVDNAAIINMWKRFNATQNKRRRAYVRKIV